MKEQNRPHNSSAILQNLHGAVPGSQLKKVLEALTQDKTLMEKKSGASSIYWFNQDILESEQTGINLDNLKEAIKLLGANQEATMEQVNPVKLQVSHLESEPETKGLSATISELRADVNDLSSKLKAKQQESDDVMAEMDMDEFDRDEALSEAKFYVGEWRQMKENVQRCLQNVKESSNQSMGDILLACGIESDETAGVSLPSLKPFS